MHCKINHASTVCCDDVSLPAGVFEPDELAQPAGEGDEVRSSVCIQISGYDLVASTEIGSDRVLSKS